MALCANSHSWSALVDPSRLQVYFLARFVATVFRLALISFALATSRAPGALDCTIDVIDVLGLEVFIVMNGRPVASSTPSQALIFHCVGNSPTLPESIRCTFPLWNNVDRSAAPNVDVPIRLCRNSFEKMASSTVNFPPIGNSRFTFPRHSTMMLLPLVASFTTTRADCRS